MQDMGLQAKPFKSEREVQWVNIIVVLSDYSRQGGSTSQGALPVAMGRSVDYSRSPCTMTWWGSGQS